MTPYEAYQKALTAGNRLPDLESVILQDAFYAYLYEENIVKGRWEEGEPVMAQNDLYAYLYAKNILKGRWKEGETNIITNAYYVYVYARDVLKWRVKNNKDFYISATSILWDKFPEEIKNDPDIMTAYFKKAVLQ